MKVSAAVSRVKVSADGQGVVSHAGVGMLRELANLTGLSAQVSAALADTYKGPWVHAPAPADVPLPPELPWSRGSWPAGYGGAPGRRADPSRQSSPLEAPTGRTDDRLGRLAERKAGSAIDRIDDGHVLDRVFRRRLHRFPAEHRCGESVQLILKGGAPREALYTLSVG